METHVGKTMHADLRLPLLHPLPDTACLLIPMQLQPSQKMAKILIA